MWTADTPDTVAPLVTATLLSREGFSFSILPTTIPCDLLGPLPKNTFLVGGMMEYDKYRTAHDSVTFNPGDEDELREETSE